MNGSESLTNHVAYIAGRFEAQLEAFAASIHVPTWELAERVGAFLLGSADRAVLRSENHLPSLRREAAKANKDAREVALVKRPYRKTQVKHGRKRSRKMSAEAREKISRRMKAYWAERRKKAA